jgi:fructose-1,6-bisphosphatase
MLAQELFPPIMSERIIYHALNMNRNTLRYQQKRDPIQPACHQRKEVTQPRALTEKERQEVKSILTSKMSCNQLPMQVYYDLFVLVST